MQRNFRSMALALCLMAVAVGVAAASPLNRKIGGDLPDYADIHPYMNVTISPDSRYAVFASDERVDDFYELYSAPLDGSNEPVRLSGPAQYPMSSSSLDWKITSDSRRVIYRDYESILANEQLFSVPIDGGQKVQLSKAEPPAAYVGAFALTSDGKRVAMSTDQGIFSISTEGGQTVRLTTAADAGDLRITADDRTVVYFQLTAPSNSLNLYSVSIDGGSPVKLNTGYIEAWHLYEDGSGIPHVAFFARDAGLHSLFTVRASGGVPEPITSQIDGRIENSTMCANGQTIVYESSTDSGRLMLASVSLSAGEPMTLAVDARMLTNGNSQYVVSPDCSSVVYGSGDSLFVVPTAGGSPTRVSYVCYTVFTYSPDSEHMVYAGRESLDQPCELRNLDMTTKSSVRVNAPLPSGGALSRWSYQITPDSQAVLYVAEQETPGVAELFMAPFDGSPIRKVSGPMTFGGNVTGYPVVSPDGRYLVYRADQERDEVHELFATALGDEAGAWTYMPLVER